MLMAYREKGIPPERRLNIRGKMGRAVLAVTAVAAAVFWLSGSGAAMAAQVMAQSFGSPGMWRRQRTVESGSRLTGIGTVMERSTGWIPGR